MQPPEQGSEGDVSPLESKESEEGASGHRGPNWEWQDSFTLIELVAKEGKNWQRLLEMFHVRHRLEHISDPSKLRVHFNTLTAAKSTVRKPFKRPSLRISAAEKRGMTKEQLATRELEFAKAQDYLEAQRQKAVGLLQQITEGEHLHHTEQPRSESKTREEIHDGVSGRKEKREARRQLAFDDAAEERAYRMTVSGIMDETSKTLRAVNESLQVLTYLMKLQLKEEFHIEMPITTPSPATSGPSTSEENQQTPSEAVLVEGTNALTLTETPPSLVAEETSPPRKKRPPPKKQRAARGKSKGKERV